MSKRLIAFGAPLALAACSLAPRTELPTPPVSPSWPIGDAYLVQNEAALPVVSYRDIFRDPRLQTLVETALANNRDLRVAAANVAEARAQARAIRAAQFPVIGVGGSALLASTTLIVNGGKHADDLIGLLLITHFPVFVIDSLVSCGILLVFNKMQPQDFSSYKV